VDFGHEIVEFPSRRPPHGSARYGAHHIAVLAQERTAGVANFKSELARLGVDRAEIDPCIAIFAEYAFRPFAAYGA
jgi:hypothetical protein